MSVAHTSTMSGVARGMFFSPEKEPSSVAIILKQPDSVGNCRDTSYRAAERDKDAGATVQQLLKSRDNCVVGPGGSDRAIRCLGRSTSESWPSSIKRKKYGFRGLK